jgi:hypothetical protein
MTKLTNSVERETAGTIFERSKLREVIVTLAPPNRIGFRLKGTRRVYWLTSEGCYAMAVKADVDTQRRDRQRRRGRS